ncbi:MAG: hypothetical protein J4F28_06025 [Nitrosopumilaceae archaeon]|nr:hypothetical protein [Nitrosopumilaceae archaeon]
MSKSYSGGAHIQEALPVRPSKETFPIEESHLGALHGFASSNPIYHGSFRQDLAGTECAIYEGDINEYWLGSIKHGTSCQPFYPTWLASAYVLAAAARGFGCTEFVDIGSGDGRIAFCAALLGMRTHSIEIDDSLVRLQKEVAASTGTDFGPVCMDALEADYGGMDISRPAFAVGGLPQMGGEMLAEGLLKKIKNCGGSVMSEAVVILAGEGDSSGPATRRSRRRGAGGLGGWGPVIAKYGLSARCVISLPTVWTFDQDKETPYIFVGLAGSSGASGVETSNM